MKDFIKIKVLLKELSDFDEVNRLFSEFFEEPYPARTAFEVSKIPKNAMIEIEAIADGSVPVGDDEQDNEEIRVNDEKKILEFAPLPHYELGEKLDILDFVRGSKVSGKRFMYYKGSGARLERAVYKFMLDLHTRKHRYT